MITISIYRNEYVLGISNTIIGGNKCLQYIQLWNFVYEGLLYKSNVNEVILRGQNLSLKCCQSLKLLIYKGKRFESFHKCNIRSVGQRASKLLAVKVSWRSQEKVCWSVCKCVSPSSSRTVSESFSKFDGQ